jgi:SprT protein
VSALSLEPITPAQREQVGTATVQCLQRAESLFELDHQPIPVQFDLRGRAAGMYLVARGRAVIRYNPYIFARHFEHGLQVTVPHEVAHYVSDRLFGLARIRPHGSEWRAVMRALGVEPRATAQFDLSGVPLRRQQRFSYHCGCSLHELSSCRHNRIRRGQVAYHCRQCGGALEVV